MRPSGQADVHFDARFAEEDRERAARVLAAASVEVDESLREAVDLEHPSDGAVVGVTCVLHLGNLGYGS
jgi:hypothetical protein